MSSRDQSSVWGSPPRMRGAAIDVPKASITPRIIPACAGNRIKECSYNSSLRDHPHVCGEQSADQMAAFCNQGSSPRVRGAGIFIYFVYIYFGIIPARAGSSSNRSMTIGTSRDHPRVRGEQNAHSVRTVPVLGSSPRVRGTVDGERDALTRRGIIPARAGSSGPAPCSPSPPGIIPAHAGSSLSRPAPRG